MKAALQVDVGRYEVRDVPVPEIKDHQCLIKVEACTVCATDLKYFKGLQTRTWPSPMGHEVTGTIAQVGAAVNGTVRKGLPPLSDGDRVLSRIVWGGFAEYVPSDADMLAPLPDNVGFEEGAIAQLLPIAVRGAELAVRPGHSVFVSGLGAAGLLCVQVAKAYAASKVIAADFYEAKRRIAREIGADLVVDPNAEDVVERVRAETGGGADVAMEAVGLEPSFRACEQAVRTGGIISVFGTHLEPLPLNMLQWEGRSLQLHIMREQRHEMPAMLAKAVDLLATGKVRLKPLLSRVMKLDEIMDAFDLYLHHPEEIVKIAVVP